MTDSHVSLLKDSVKKFVNFFKYDAVYFEITLIEKTAGSSLKM